MCLRTSRTGSTGGLQEMNTTVLFINNRPATLVRESEGGRLATGGISLTIRYINQLTMKSNTRVF